MTVADTDPSSNATLTRLTWQVKGEMRSVRLEIDEMVCAQPVVAKDGEVYDLGGLLKKLLESGQKKNEPKTKI